MKNRIFLESQNIYLRPIVKQDICENYIHWFDDEEVCKGNSHHRFPSSEESLLKYIESIYISNTQITLAIITKEDNIHIGNISLQNINYINRSAELAIIIGEKKYWGKGLGFEAGNLIIKHGFDNINLNRIYLGTYDTNYAMQKLAKQLGFKQEGVRRQADYKNGRYVDIVEFGILKEEFYN